MTLNAPPLLDGLTYSGLQLRLADAMLAQSDGTAGGASPGVRPGDVGLVVSLAGSTINVTAGVASLFRPSFGLYRAATTSAWTGTLAAANATNPRIDLVYLRAWDNAVDSAGLAQADIVYLQGTAAASPVAPVPGASVIYIPLALISVPAVGGGSASVASAIRPVHVAPGGMLPVTASGVATAGVFAGQARFNTVRGCPEYWSGTAWLAQGDWAAYTPTWTGVTTNPALGNGTLTGRTTLIGKTCKALIRLQTGSTTTFGTGAWKFSLPYSAADATALHNIGYASGNRSVGAAVASTFVYQSDANTCIISGQLDASGAAWGPTVPVTWVNTSTNTFYLNLTYEIA